MSAAELQIGVRADCAVQDVRDALWKHKSLVKPWLMRGTLHLIPAEDLPVYAAAMSTRWIRINKSWLKLIHLSEQDLLKLVAEIGEQLDGTPRTREEIVKAVGKGHSPPVPDAFNSDSAGLLKPAAPKALLSLTP